jgi:hypothetical protein
MNLGTTNRLVYQVKNGLTVSCWVRISVQDNQLPAISCENMNQTVIADPGECFATLSTLTSPVVSDNCTSASFLTLVNGCPGRSSFFHIGTTYLNWTVTDESGQSPKAVVTRLTFRTRNPRSLPVPMTSIIYPLSPGKIYVTILNPGTATAIDNCSTGPSLEIRNNAPSDYRYPVGTTILGWTATDQSGNISTCKQSIPCNG